MGDVLAYLVVYVVSRLASYGVLAWDERRMTPRASARAWPESTKLGSVFMFGMLCLPIHFARTRRTLVGFIVGIAWMAAALAVTALAEGAIELVFPPTP